MKTLVYSQLSQKQKKILRERLFIERAYKDLTRRTLPPSWAEIEQNAPNITEFELKTRFGNSVFDSNTLEEVN